MSIFELILIGIAIAADSFAASILIGIKEIEISKKRIGLVAIIFATFQSLMPVIGYILINIFSRYLIEVDHYIAFIFLTYLGFNMIRDKEDDDYKGISLISIVILAIAVTIDAFAIGITYSLLNVSIVNSVIINFFITFLSTIVGIILGIKLGNLIKEKANIVGGIILIIIGFKILFSHLGII